MPIASSNDSRDANSMLHIRLDGISTVAGLGFRHALPPAPPAFKSLAAEGKNVPPDAAGFPTPRTSRNGGPVSETRVRSTACGASEESMRAFLPFIPAATRYAATKVAPHEVDDIVQDSLLRIMAAHTGADIRSPKSYFIRVVKAVIIDHFRHNVSRCRKDHCELVDRHHPVDTLNPCRVLIGRQELSRLTAKLSTLSPRTREMLIAIRVEGLSFREAAARFEVCHSTIEKQVSRAITCLSAL